MEKRDYLDKEFVLDKGYIILWDTLGTDLTPVNAARVSYDKRSDHLTEKDVKLLRFLARNGHTSPFRHVMLQFEVYAPLMVARQWWKYAVGSSHLEATGDNMEAWNESSRRYITEEPEFYIPRNWQWRSAPENSKQGSGDIVSRDLGTESTEVLTNHIAESVWLYEQAMKEGVCAEQARLFLPAYAMYVRWYWTASLQSVIHFINQRIEHDAQAEIQQYAKKVLSIVKHQFPDSWAAFTEI
jgi:thymidylate synthase (FAD)